MDTAKKIINKYDELQIPNVHVAAIDRPNKHGMHRMDITYSDEEHPLMIQTPVFKKANIKLFKKGANNSNDALITYFTIKYKDEEKFAHTMHDIGELVKTHVMKNAREPPTKKSKKNDSQPNLLFKSPINEPMDYNPAFRTNILIDEDSEPIGCEFFDKDGTPLTFDDFKTKSEDESSSMRAIVHVTHAYILANKTYGYKSHVRVLQLADKDPEVEVVDDAIEESGELNKSKMGFCFL